MQGLTHVPLPTDKKGTKKLSHTLSKRMLALGFDPVAPIHEAGGHIILQGGDQLENQHVAQLLQSQDPVRFIRAQERRLRNVCEKALFRAFPGPVVLAFMRECGPEPAPSWMVTMLVETMQISYETEQRDPRWHKSPGYYLRGLLFDGSFGRKPDAPRVHVLFRGFHRDMPRTACLQIVRAASSDAPRTRLNWGVDSPLCPYTLQ